MTFSSHIAHLLYGTVSAALEHVHVHINAVEEERSAMLVGWCIFVRGPSRQQFS
jgi:hypothetical protein